MQVSTLYTYAFLHAFFNMVTWPGCFPRYLKIKTLGTVIPNNNNDDDDDDDSNMLLVSGKLTYKYGQMRLTFRSNLIYKL